MNAGETIEPPIRFPEFKEQWETKPIARILERCSTPVDVESETEYIQIGMRSHGKGIFHKDAVTGKSLGNKRVFWIHPDCLVMNIIFAWEQAVGKTTEREDGLIASHRFPMYTPKDKQADIDFIVRFFLRPRGKHLLGLASPGGAGRNRTLGQKEFDKLKVVVPTLPEQKKIADFLTSVDERIGQLIKKKALLEDYKKGVMQQLFSQQIRFKDDNGNEFPDWEEKTIDEIANFRRGSFPQPYGLKKWYDDENGFPFIQVYDVGKNFRLKDETKRQISDLAKDLSVFVPKGSIVITIQGSIGRIAVTQYDACCDRTLLIFTEFKVPIAEVYFVYALYLRFEIEARIAVGGTIKTITKEKLRVFPINLPSVAEQKKIADFLTSVDQKIERVSQQIAKTQTFKKGLLQQMFV
ncbi:restriction endonuclease subunit S [Akkermansiaceae bacterium]|nr:restriction endonuclease subunit S [bacterium]MDB4395743.1 restriction endonuclease subunit S [Akkermansiaceae bacterium]